MRRGSLLAVAIVGLSLCATASAAPAPKFSVVGGKATEGRAVKFIVKLSVAPKSTVKVRYATVAGTARAGSDFRSKRGTLTFRRGQKSKPVSIATLPDTTDEPNERFSLKLSRPTGARIARASAAGTILDDDAPVVTPPPPPPPPPPAPPPRTLSVTDVEVTEAASGTASFTVTLSLAHTEPVTVQYSTTDSTAAAGADYTASTSSIAFLPGQTTRQIQIPILDDSLDEDPETFLVSLFNAVNATVSDGVATGTINDDTDSAPVVDIEGTSLLEPNLATDSTTANVTVKLSAPSGKTISVAYATEDGSATRSGAAVGGSSVDYEEKTGFLTFNPGETTKQIPVTIRGDAVDEQHETFKVKITSAAPAGLCPLGCTLGLTEFSIPTASSSPAGIAAGPDGRVWFTEKAANKIGQITRSGVITERISMFDAGGQPNGLALGPDGRLWYAGRGAPQRVGAENAPGHTTGGATGYGVALGASDHPSQITAGPDGNMWFAGFWDDGTYPGAFVGRISAVFDYDFKYTGHTGQTIDVAAGPDGNVWASEPGRLLRVEPNGTVTPHTISTERFADARGLTAGPAGDGALWFTEYASGGFGSNNISRMTVAGQVTNTFPIPTANAGALDIVAGPDGNLWFTEETANKIGRITPAGTITEQTVPTSNAKPTGIAVGPDGNIWFTEADANKIGRLDLGLTTATVTIANDDYPEVQLLNASTNEPLGLNPLSGGPMPGIITFTVRLSRCSTRPVSLDWTTADDTAVAPNDYEAASGSLQIGPGECEKTFNVTVMSDGHPDVDEGASESFSVYYSNLRGAVWSRDGDYDDFYADGHIMERLRFSVDDVTHVEGTGAGVSSATFTVSASRPAPYPVTVSWDTQNESATAPADYTSASSSVAFAVGDTSKTISVPVNGDALDEPDETFQVRLWGVSDGRATFRDAFGTGSITDDDPEPTLTVGDVPVTEPPPGQFVVVNVPVTLSAPSGKPVSVSFATGSGSASPGSDYAPTSGGLNFLPGETTKMIQVQVRNQEVFDVPEGTETVPVHLSGPSNAGIMRSPGLVIIND